jgi:coenzyme F420-reducing hydrogenase delta subunit
MTYAGLKLPEEVRTFELPCAGRVNEVLLMETLRDGMDGILVVGCRKDNCTNIDGNRKAEKRLNRVKEILKKAGITNKHVDMIYTSPDESRRLYQYLENKTEVIGKT